MHTQTSPEQIAKLNSDTIKKSNPNMYRIPIPIVQKGIDLIAGNKFPIIVCQCGNIDQMAFTKFIKAELIIDKEKPWRKRQIQIEHILCRRCKTSIPKIEFDLKAQKLVKESEEK